MSDPLFFLTLFNTNSKPGATKISVSPYFLLAVCLEISIALESLGRSISSNTVLPLFPYVANLSPIDLSGDVDINPL
ncbi:MAG: hypothetical protein APG08_01605 [Candidatus Methanofastidiosum methylothiophilum]|uniref:Uncharacterized protein n=1 Tax=Candidatus Methanofastidiosum methylothiophilum TaxID=1705564 RepID=A0A150JDW9_9EURY|nr:MAG: hypothetical protein APG08_01605 [Candidatus Methanofastidiosum methylthiophilus]KYC55618.1 MAG: hypothetical protein APG09_01600 [Candidatus Methanofastidiosum methylthiophilus]